VSPRPEARVRNLRMSQWQNFKHELVLVWVYCLFGSRGIGQMGVIRRVSRCLFPEKRSLYESNEKFMFFKTTVPGLLAISFE
jgi:hypothetical protein